MNTDVNDYRRDPEAAMRAACRGKGPTWARHFADTYGYDLATWPGYPTLLAMRDLMQLTGPIRRATSTHTPTYHHALRQRLTALCNNDTSTTWTAL